MPSYKKIINNTELKINIFKTGRKKPPVAYSVLEISMFLHFISCRLSLLDFYCQKPTDHRHFKLQIF